MVIISYNCPLINLYWEQMEWTESLKPTDTTDTIARLSTAIVLIIWLITKGLAFHAEYPKELVELAGQPWWRLLMVLTVRAGAYWCPTVGVLAALTIILYLVDVRSLTQV